MHFTRMGNDPNAAVPIIVSGEGCYVYDADGKRYLDGLAALFCVNVGHGRPELARGRGQRRCASSTSTRPGATRTRARSSSRRGSPALTPGDLNRVFFTSGGSEAVESALKLARAYHRLTGNGQKTRSSRARSPTTARRSARSPRPASRLAARRSSRSRPAAATCPTPTATAGRADRDPLWAADAIARADRVRGTRDGGRRDPRAGAERRRLHRRRRTATSSACARSATRTTCC